MTKKEVIEIVNELIKNGKVFSDEELSREMEAYKVDFATAFDKPYYKCVLCGSSIDEKDVLVSCRLRYTSHTHKSIKPFHVSCLDKVRNNK